MKTFLNILCYSFLLVLTQNISASDGKSAGLYALNISASDGCYTDQVGVVHSDRVFLVFSVPGGTPFDVHIYKSETPNRDSAVGFYTNIFCIVYSQDPNIGTGIGSTDTNVIAGRIYYYWGQAKPYPYTNSEWTDYDTGYAGHGPAGTIQFSASSNSVNENAGSVTLTVTRSGGSSGAASVHCATNHILTPNKG